MVEWVTVALLEGKEAAVGDLISRMSGRRSCAEHETDLGFVKLFLRLDYMLFKFSSVKCGMSHLNSIFGS